MNDTSYDKIISNDNIVDTTLALLTNQHTFSMRPAGIFTQQDLININQYVDYALSLPSSPHDILSWFKVDKPNDLPIETERLIKIIGLIKRHAGKWDNIEQKVKEQSINLSLTSRNIIQTGTQILDYINHMPIIQQISDSLENFSIKELKKITYQNDDQQITTELLSILKFIKEDIHLQSKKTTEVKKIISDFRIDIIGGYLSTNQHVDSLLFNIKSIYIQLNSQIDDSDSDGGYLYEKIEMLKKETYKLEQEYNHFVKLSFTGLVGGLIGLAITGGIFGSQAEKIRQRKNDILEEIIKINNEVNRDIFIKKNIFNIQIQLQQIEGYFKDARLAVEHLDYMWLTLLAEINQSIEFFSSIDNAANLLKFITRFKKIITSWDAVKIYSEQLINLFEAKR